MGETKINGEPFWELYSKNLDYVLFSQISPNFGGIRWVIANTAIDENILISEENVNDLDTPVGISSWVLIKEGTNEILTTFEECNVACETSMQFVWFATLPVLS